MTSNRRIDAATEFLKEFCNVYDSREYDSRVAPSLSYNTSVTRGNKFKLQNQSFNHNFRKFFFSARIVNMEQFTWLMCSLLMYLKCT